MICSALRNPLAYDVNYNTISINCLNVSSDAVYFGIWIWSRLFLRTLLCLRFLWSGVQVLLVCLSVDEWLIGKKMKYMESQTILIETWTCSGGNFNSENANFNLKSPFHRRSVIRFRSDSFFLQLWPSA